MMLEIKDIENPSTDRRNFEAWTLRWKKGVVTILGPTVPEKPPFALYQLSEEGGRGEHYMILTGASGANSDT